MAGRSGWSRLRAMTFVPRALMRFSCSVGSQQLADLASGSRRHQRRQKSDASIPVQHHAGVARRWSIWRRASSHAWPTTFMRGAGDRHDAMAAIIMRRRSPHSSLAPTSGRLIVEPGRYTNGRRCRRDRDRGGAGLEEGLHAKTKRWVHLDIGLRFWRAFAETEGGDRWSHPPDPGNFTGPDARRALAGPTCDSADISLR